LLIPALGLEGCVVPSVPPPLPRVQAPAPLPPPPPPRAAAPAVPHEHLVDTSGKTDIALLVPLSGPLAGLGHDLLDAAQLAVVELAGDTLVLTPKDTKGTAAGAADAARRAIAEGARLIVGPLTAGEVEAVQPEAKAAGINVLAFSNVVKVAGNGVFLLGFLPQQEAGRVARYAVSTGLNHLAVLAPASDYGHLAAESFEGAAAAAGATVDPVEFYAAGGEDLRAVAKHLAAGGRFGFGGVLLPEPDPARLRSVATALPAAEIDPSKVRLLGTSRWETSSLGQEPALVGGWYAAAPPEARAGFERHFITAFGHRPQRLATLAYDAVGVAAVLERTPGANFSAPALENPSGFAGADGIFRLLPDGTAERGLAVLQVEPGGAIVLSPAPESFAGSGQ
jgi:branched-chain amino acid transport system substrate-binding protein